MNNFQHVMGANGPPYLPTIRSHVCGPLVSQYLSFEILLFSLAALAVVRGWEAQQELLKHINHHRWDSSNRLTFINWLSDP